MKLFNGRDDIATGIALPFGSGRSNFKLLYTTLDQAKTNIINLLLTHKGERFMQPNFGTNLRRYLFRPNSDALRSEIRTELSETLKHWLPYVNVDKISVSRVIENIDEYKINIDISFSVIDDITKFTTVTFKFGSNGSVSVGNI